MTRARGSTRATTRPATTSPPSSRGIPPWTLDAAGAEGLDGDTVEERMASAMKMAGGALKSYDEMSDAASYATWFFATQDTPSRATP